MDWKKKNILKYISKKALCQKAEVVRKRVFHGKQIKRGGSPKGTKVDSSEDLRNLCFFSYTINKTIMVQPDAVGTMATQ